MGRIWVQKGYNCLWPYEIEVWKWGEPVPEWLSDQAGITFIDGEGNITLKTRELSGGGVEILQAGSNEALVRLKNKGTDMVYFPLPSIGYPKFPPEFTPYRWIGFPKSISKKELQLIYKPLSEK